MYRIRYKESTVARASNKSPSVRTTIPEKIVQEINIKAGDVLDWEVVQEKGGRMIIKVRKLE